MKKEEPKNIDSSTPARVFALTQAEAEARPSVVTCQISSAGVSYSVLIDSGATQSYVSSKIVDSLGHYYPLGNWWFPGHVLGLCQ